MRLAAHVWIAFLKINEFVSCFEDLDGPINGSQGTI